jgi:putative transposase
MSRYRLYPTPAQEAALLEQCRQLTEARLAFPWLAEGSVIVQQQALRDFHAARAS